MATPKKQPKQEGNTANVPAALAKRAAQQVAAKQERLRAEGRADVELILRRKARIAEDFYDIGEALLRLKRPGVAEAMGRASFSEICEKDVAISVTVASELVAIVSGLPRKDALRMGQSRALALLSLANATPEPDTAASLEKTVRTLPSGRRLEVSKASANELKAAATELRRAKAAGSRSAPTKRPKGRTTTPDEQARAAALQTALHAAGLAAARVKAIATKPGQEAHLRIDGIPVDALAKLRAALGKVK